MVDFPDPETPMTIITAGAGTETPFVGLGSKDIGSSWCRSAIRELDLARRLVYHAAWLDTQGIDATKEVSMVKAYCGELVNEVMYDCVQFHGGMGFMRESTIERMSRDARVQNIGGGATEVMLEEVAKRL